MEGQKMYSSTNGGTKNSQDERGKIFVGGLNKITTTDGLRQFFCRFGEVEDAVAMWDKHQNRSRCFGYVKFRDPDVVQLVLRSKPHFIDEKEVDVKECLPRSVTMSMSQKARMHKVFVGGLPHDVDEQSIRRAFQNFGKILEVLIVSDPQTRKSKGFGFVSFEKQESAAAAVNDHHVMVNGKKTEVKAIDSTKGRQTHGGYPHGGYPPHDGGMYYHQPPGYGYGYPDYHGHYAGPSGPWAGGPWGAPADHSAPPMISGPGGWGEMHGGPHGAPPGANSWSMEPPGTHSSWGVSSGWPQSAAAPASAAPASAPAPTSAWGDPSAWQHPSAASSHYGATSQYGAASSQYGAASSQYGAAASAQYGAASSQYGASSYGTAPQAAAPPSSAAPQSAPPSGTSAPAAPHSSWMMPPSHGAAPPGPTSVAPPGTTSGQYNYHPYRR